MGTGRQAANSIRKQILSSFLIMSLLFLVAGFLFLSAATKFKDQLSAATPIQEQLLRAQSIIWLDEVLTHSIKSYLYSKDEAWKNRYEEYGCLLYTSLLKKSPIHIF